MYTYQIIKHKEVLPVIVQNSSSHISGQIYSQPHLNYYLQSKPKVGDYVWYKSTNEALYSPHQISYVSAIENNYSNMKGGLIPRTHEVLTIEPFSNGKPWFAWVDIRNYQVLTEDELKKFINVDISNYIKTTLKASGATTQAPAP